MGWLRELALPRTDAGVAVQTAVAVVVVAALLWATRRSPHLRLLTIGVAVMLAALGGLRAAH